MRNRKGGGPESPFGKSALLEDEIASPAGGGIGVGGIHEDGDGASEGGVQLMVDDGVVGRPVLRRNDVQDIPFRRRDPVGLQTVQNVPGISMPPRWTC